MLDDIRANDDALRGDEETLPAENPLDLLKLKMKRAALLQEIRKMRFEEAYTGWQAKRLTQEKAAWFWGCERTFRRYIVVVDFPAKLNSLSTYSGVHFHWTTTVTAQHNSLL
ncbi:MAG: hypothetical protein CTY17_07645 [Methylomonas sp.]|nr:MAG: hypothetical protein CTY17_07645 [Methylomonas sp.]PPD55125.1 MAG: hypothetical protein CTY11_02065 [Methylomonas sp.]